MSSHETNDTTKLEHISSLKSHIKKGFIDLSSAPKYFHVLIIALDSPNIELRSNALSTLTYLIKRISVQDKSESLLKRQSNVVVPILINKLIDPSVKTLARNALENYWIADNVTVEQLILSLGFNGQELGLEVVNWLIHVCNLNHNFPIGKFISSIDKLNKDPHSEIAKQVQILFNRHYPKGAGRDLSSKPEVTNKKPQEQVNTPAKTNTDIKTPDDSLSILLDKVNYELDQSIVPENIHDSAQLIHQFNSYLPCFQGKETESNWKLREKNIIHMRSILRGNSIQDFKSDLIACIKDLTDGISKAVSSLRTTLSMHGCQLLKECSIILNSDFDNIAEALFPVLIKLCSSTKSIASNNANMCISAFYNNMTYSSKLISRILLVSEERNYQPRSYSAIWLQILILRFGNSEHESYIIDTVNKLLVKLLRDANPHVRSAAKDCYWTFSKIFPDSSDAFLQKLDSNTVKVLQRSRPTSSSVDKPRVTSSLRESINERKKLNLQRSSISGRNTPETVTQPLPKPMKSSISTRLGSPVVRSSTEPPIVRPASTTRTKTLPLKQPIIEPTRSHSFGSIPKNEPKVEPKVDSFTYNTEKDPIVSFLSSQDTTVIIEGINLLKFAVTQEQLPKQVRDSLKQISIQQPMLLKPLFMANDKTFKASATLFSINDFIRLCCLIFPEVDSKTVDLILACVSDIDSYYDTCINLLTNVANTTTTIYETQDLIMQLIKYKQEIAKSIMQIISISLGKVPIADVYFSKLLAGLFDLIILFKMTDNYQLCCQLIKQLYSINNIAFLGAMEQIDDNTREEIEIIVGLDSTFSLNPLSKSIYDLTEIPFSKSTKELEFSPIKLNNDFTMIRPSRDVLKQQVANTEERERSSLVENFASVQITNAKSSIEAIIEKIDPLKSISNKSKKIAIYEDSTNEEKSVEGYHMAKIATDGVITWSLEQFESCCQHLKSPDIDSVKIMRLIGILGSIPNCKGDEILQFFNNIGKYNLNANLWIYFENYSNLKYSDIVNGLVLLKLNLKYNPVDADKLFRVLEQTSQCESPGSEIHCIWEAIVQEIRDDKLQDIMLDYLQSKDVNPNVASICLNYFVKNHDPVVTPRLINVLTPFFTSNNVELFRLAIVCYSKLLLDSSSEIKTSLNQSKLKLPLHQQRLIEYYMK
ncbi:Protein STU1 [Spathaspora sp. JA1]|nr:Protein STU1 [Spathaspora sp. JA1]